MHSSNFNIMEWSQVEEGKILWAQGQQELAVNLLKYILQHSDLEAADSAAIHCLTGKWLADTRSDRYHLIFVPLDLCVFFPFTFCPHNATGEQIYLLCINMSTLSWDSSKNLG